IGFITLTLPSKQKDPTKFITNNLFNQFLTEIRQRTKMENYVWRLEFQKNKNVHYHIVTDTYIDYHLVLKIWNRILDNYGYIKPYTEKHNKLSLKIGRASCRERVKITVGARSVNKKKK